VLSGPAGGLIGMARLGAALGEARLIGFDMGGTSTDVSLHDGEFSHRFEHRIGGARLTVPMLDVHTIAAGGGSILALRDGRCVVGPESAGAAPGPACYGRGGPATMTDVQVVLGRLLPATMPRVFGPGGQSPIDPQASRTALARLAAPAGIEANTATEVDADDALARFAAGFLEVGVAAMAAAIRHVAIGQGLDPAGFTLVRLRRRRRPARLPRRRGERHRSAGRASVRQRAVRLGHRRRGLGRGAPPRPAGAARRDAPCRRHRGAGGARFRGLRRARGTGAGPGETS
jgi:N-methylhydantoinase A/oxoprolinase/acetone carboxylase beta subunit